MKKYNKILEAINKGIQLALDDFDDEYDLIGQKTETIKDTHYTKEYLDLLNMVVDLGLPSGTLWAKYNLGCDYELLNSTTIEDNKTTQKDWVGNYYQWGEIKPIHNYTTYDNYASELDIYKFCKGTVNYLTKYCHISSCGRNGFTDNLTHLLPEDDAATQNMHIGNYKFHIPSKQQWEELLQYTEKHKEPGYIVGITFKSKINGNKLFIPYGGRMIINKNDSFISKNVYKLDSKDDNGYLWSSDLYETNPFHAYNIDLYDCYRLNKIKTVTGRGKGLNIRPVINL